MASKSVASIALLLTINLFFLTLVSSTHHKTPPCPPPPPKAPAKAPPPPPKAPAKAPPPPPSKASTPCPPPPPKASTPCPPPPPKAPSPPAKETCPIDTLKLGVCANVLNGLLGLVIGTPSKTQCCPLLDGLVDLEAPICLCTALKANVLGINLNVPISLSLLLNFCGKDVPAGFQCPTFPPKNQPIHILHLYKPLASFTSIHNSPFFPNQSVSMASKSVASIALLLTVNLLFFTLVASKHHHTTPCPPPPPKSPKPPKPPAPAKGTCPIDTLKLGVCANLLGDLLHLVIGTPPKKPCCPLLEGLADLEAAVCLCTALKANVLGLNLNVPISLSLLLNYCGKGVPAGFQCP
ncbi:pEARLI1-like lipid transfer protein 2 [Euphorbia lathyris]|uniref:pEARLI1-like lipid transfer protein 2 n=1 Tax=Euphorbia lathyris TaxID=212925 RepID=UPI0033136FAB